ncbi:MAG: hypothetical protein LQ341_002178 [Variospora aurantia]|nr:MAG: hypothetical protein LQ341_002178 [Variospora aurantia]
MREISMIAWMNDLTDIPDWYRMIFDVDFTFEWKSAKLLTGYDVTRSMCIEEVKYRVNDYVQSQMVLAIDGGVLKSDVCLPTSTRVGLARGIASLRGHLRSNAKQEDDSVIDLVDPYLFPFRWARTRCLRQGAVSRMECIRRCSEGEAAKMPPEDDCRQDAFAKYRNEMAWSRHYQWLPFDVRFEDDGRGRSRIDGYVNNVHPFRHANLYGSLEILVDELLPLFNRILVDLKAPGYQNQRIHLVCFGRDPFIKREPDPFKPPEQRAYSSYCNHEGQYQSSIFVDLKREFWNIGVQMILQIRDINLTPSKPDYDGEDWHVQGQTNERICATAMYIYSTSNISTTTGSCPTVSFRRRVFPEEAIAAKGEITTPPFLPQIYGAKHGDPVIQKLGDVVLRENRVVVWPNVFQTRLNKFTLDDKEKEGHLRVATLHLIDPNRRVISTAMVPCQRRDWWADTIRNTCPCLYRLPREVFQHIIEMIDDESYPISVGEGKRDREDFKRERELFRQKHTIAMDGYDEWDFYGEPGVGDIDDGE